MVKHNIDLRAAPQQVEATLSGYYNDAAAWDAFGKREPYILIALQTEAGKLQTWIHNDQKGELPKVDKENPTRLMVTFDKTRSFYSSFGHWNMGDQNVVTAFETMIASKG